MHLAWFPDGKVWIRPADRGAWGKQIRACGRASQPNAGDLPR
ncbi:hypothetical protein NSU_1694 [Novosphingobium pentaromativorans US6-1]|uniref:Uncharacterized protein n=1 Tax=Novosphingobium pentaromativorans US6-1 TaxID=1088721 RepID=G6EBH3_9SPHN|nr:hypothetical protein NSU_1694 [Novosphingobium pentaromativorans US6-1]